ncbi:hypothetical protein DSM43276_03161 [Mycobacteroides salmoniphilum]|nr:hypothetical protein DSM43276_03161 [Mycobacteroides salmoniphilum]
MHKLVVRSAFAVMSVSLVGLGVGSALAHADPIPAPAPAPAPNPYLNPHSSSAPGAAIYGEMSPYAGGQAPGVSSPQPGIVPGYVPGGLGPLASEISTGSSGYRPGTNAILPGYMTGLPVPDFPANHIQGPPLKLPGN